MIVIAISMFHTNIGVPGIFPVDFIIQTIYVYMHTCVKRITFLWYSRHRLRPGAHQLGMTQPDF